MCSVMAFFYLVPVAFLLVILNNHVVECARILGVFPAPGYSQYLLGERLMRALAERGHEVSMIAPYQPREEIENFTTVDTREILKLFEDDDLFYLSKLNIFSQIMETYREGYVITEATLKHPNVQSLLHSEGDFDLIIVEHFFCEALMGFAAHFQAPLVLFSSIGVTEWNNHLMGNSNPPSISPLSYSSYTRQMSFFQRTKNFITIAFDWTYKYLVAFPQHSEFLARYFPKPINLDDVMYNASLLLLNSHVTTSENAPMVHGMVEIGGFHVYDINPLPQNIKEYLDDAENGAIFFSLGTNLKPSHLKKETIRALLRVFAKLDQKVLWKFDRSLPHKPNNVFISKWFKQNDILAHPNVQLFMTHGGLLSTTEAVFHGIPIIGIPIFGDQRMNLARAEKNGFAKILHLDDITEETLYASINETLNNPKYLENARKMSNIMRDGSVRPLDTAMYWIEYVIRHRGHQFKSPVLDLYWYQYYMLDIFVFFIVIVLITLSALEFVIVKFVVDKVNVKRSKKLKKK